MSKLIQTVKLNSNSCWKAPELLCSDALMPQALIDEVERNGEREQKV